MTDTYLRSLGFVLAAPAPHHRQTSFDRAWRYQYDHVATDGAHLFIEHPLGIATCRLSAVEAPLTPQDIFGSVGLHDRRALEAAISAFYKAHGGMGASLPVRPTSAFQPYRRQL